MTAILEMRGIGKSFPGVRALDQVNLTVGPGEIHAICGENGAGKSTLMKVLSGVYPHGTYEGDILYEGQPMAFGGIRDSEDNVFGELRVTTTTGFGTLWLVPRLPRFYAKYPDLKIDLMLEERVLDLPMREADLAIRMKEPSQSDLIRRRLLDIRMRLYATPEYLESAGIPERLPDIAAHRVICQNPTTPQVTAGAMLSQTLLAQNPRSTLMVNTYFGVLQAVQAHLGIGVLPDYLTLDFPERLRRVMPNHESAEVPVFLAFPEELRASRRITAFRDFVIEEIQEYRRMQHALPAEADSHTGHA